MILYAKLTKSKIYKKLKSNFNTSKKFSLCLVGYAVTYNGY